MEVTEAGRRLLVRLGVGTAAVIGLTGAAGAHGPHVTGPEPVAFALVLALPIAAGSCGGAIAIRRLRGTRTAVAAHRVGVVLGVSLAVLGATFGISAVASSRSLGLLGVAVGAITARLASGRDGTGRRECHADLALGAVSAHRLLEGVAIGALYSAGVAVGLLGAVLVAGHAAVETAFVGATYATRPARTRAIAAVVVLQLGYAGGAVAGLGIADALPASTRTLALALAAAGGALLVVGAGEAGRSIDGDGRHRLARQ